MADDPTIVVVPPVATPEEEIEDAHEEAEDIAELAATVQLGVERQTEVLTEVKSCQEKLDQLSTKLEQPPLENPVIQKTLEEIAEIRRELANLKSLILDMIQSNRQPHASSSMPLPDNPSEPNPDVSTAEPVRAEPEEPKPRRKVNKI